MNPFMNKIAIVTGGASGIGRALCERLGKKGAIVTIADIDIAGAERVAELIVAAGGRARASFLDVKSADSIDALIEQTASEYGRLDYMFNNAGISVQGEVRDMDRSHWQHILDINLLGVIHGTTAAYQIMVRQGFGHIVNTASLLGLVGMGLSTPYATTKHAIVGLSTSLRAEGADLGVRVSAVCPGFIETGLYDAATIVKADNKEFFSHLVPFKRMDARKAAHEILKGVERNKAIIAFPFHAKVLWWSFRLDPDSITRSTRGVIKKFRKIRQA